MGGSRGWVGECVERRNGQTERGGHNTGRRVGGEAEVSVTEAIQAAAINLLERRCHMSLARWC